MNSLTAGGGVGGMNSSQSTKSIQAASKIAGKTMSSSRGWDQIWSERIAKEVERGKSYNKKEMSALSTLVKLPHERLQVPEIAQMSVEKKLLKSEQNDINFYNIPTYDRKRAKKRNNTNFRTQHQISDKALLGDTKLFSEQKLTNYEKNIRSDLRKEDPKNFLLLGEIYKKLEDSLEDESANNQQNYMNDRNSKQNDIKLVEGLDGWIKHQKVLQSEKEAKKAQNFRNPGSQNKTSMQATPTAAQERMQFNRKETIKRMSSTLPNLHSKESHTSQQHSPEGATRFPQLVGMLKGDGASPFGTGTAKAKRMQSMMSGTAHGFTDVVQDQEPSDGSVRSGGRAKFSRDQSVHQGAEDGGVGVPTGADGTHKSKFFDALHDALKTINEKEKEKANEANSVMYDKDRGLRKTIKNYMKKVPDITDPKQKLKGEQVAMQEFTTEGMRQAIEDLFKIDDEEGISSVIDRARFYEKQAGLIESQLISKIRDTISLINNKVNTARILRLENYQLLRKINQLKTLIKQLSEDLVEQQGKASKGQKFTNDSQFFGDNQVAKRKLAQSEVMSAGTNSNPISPMPNASMVVGGEARSSRQHLIGNLMNNVQKVNELEGEIATLRNTLVSYEQRIKENDAQIILVEENINTKKKELKALQKGKKIFLLELLKNGKDARSEGLSWVIRSIWNGQEKVFDSYLPDFLDQKAKEYLLQRSQKEDDLQNMVSLLNMQLELYKANMMINDHMKDIEGLQIDEDDDEAPYKVPEQNSTLTQGGYDPNTSQASSSLIGGVPGQFSNTSNLLPNLSKIDVRRIKYEQTQKRRHEKLENVDDLMEGVDPSQQNIVQRTLNELNQSKQTSNDIIYNQTQRKIKEVVRNARQQQLEMQLMKEREKLDAEINGTLLNANQSIISSGDTKPSQKIVLYENQNVINKYDSREEFVKQYEQLCHKIDEKNKQIKAMEDEELMRIIREFDYKNYRKRMGASCQVVLCSLFGCYKADKELIRHGMTRK